MAQLTHTITFKWWNGSKEKEIPETHINELEEHAIAKISHMIQKGFVSGELLNSFVSYPEEVEVEYRGSWEYRRVNADEESH